jgi:hypothetical protein
LIAGIGVHTADVGLCVGGVHGTADATDTDVAARVAARIVHANGLEGVAAIGTRFGRRGSVYLLELLLQVLDGFTHLHTQHRREEILNAVYAIRQVYLPHQTVDPSLHFASEFSRRASSWFLLTVQSSSYSRTARTRLVIMPVADHNKH